MTVLAHTVFESEKFHTTIRSIRLRLLQAEFPMISMNESPPGIDWNFALLCASALSSTQEERCQVAVLRIATGCLTLDDADLTHKSAAAALLDRVGNHRSVELAEARRLVDANSWSSLPPLLRMETIKNRLQLSIPLSTGENMSVNSFQNELWMDAEDSDWLSVSAPTSAGKSRIVREWFLERLRTTDRLTAVYLAPTRALVEEVSREFRRTVSKSTRVIVMPWDAEIDTSCHQVLVLTQERLHLIQQSRFPFKIDLLFVDEAQGLGSAQRGVLLQQVVDRAVVDHPSLQVIFASPLSANPDLLLGGRPRESRARAITSEAVTVSQNLIRVEGVRRAPAKRSLSFVHDGEPIPTAHFELENRATTVSMRLAYVAHALGGDSGGNIVYVNGPDEAEKVARNIADLLDPGGLDEEVLHLQELVRSAVHPRYSLADTLGHGVAFHYGNMPLAIRTEIERLFGSGKIKHLVCTSTLLEGVNLPCRTIFMRNPQKGRGNALEESDFWNLAGRAGRWGKEFQGNIVCIDTDDPELWENLPTVRRRSMLRIATHEGLKNSAPLVAYIRNGFPFEDAKSTSEYIFSYIAAKYASGVSLANCVERVPEISDRSLVEAALVQSVDESQIPRGMIARHAGISPTSMQRLLEHFRATDGDPHDLVLPLPEESDAKQRYHDSLLLIGQVMTTAFGSASKAEGSDKRQWQLANLIVNWMKGMPLARLIEQRASGDIPIARAIRNVMSDIETVARFQAPKYLSCYADILSVYGAERGIENMGNGQDITMLLELGVSRPSEVVLMSLGLSRAATIALSQYVTVDSWTADGSLRWLRRQNIQGMDLPVLIQKEIIDMLLDADSPAE